MINWIAHFVVLFVVALLAVGNNLAQEPNSNRSRKIIEKSAKDKNKKSRNNIDQDNSKNNDKIRQTKQEDVQAKKQINRRRIVDAKTLKKRSSVVGEILLKPLRYLAPIVSARLTKFEEDREYEVFLKIKNMPIVPIFGGVGEGSGFGIGIGASTRDSLSKGFRIVASSLVTTKGYVGNSLSLEIKPERFSNKRLKISLVGEQLILPKQHFFGRGIGSRKQDETTYFHRQLGVGVSGEFRLNKNIKIGVFSEFTRNDITEGTDSDENSLTEIYNSTTLPGLGRNIRLLDLGAFVQFQKLDSPNNPHSGWFTRFSFSNAYGIGNRKFSWKKYELDSRAYIPMGSTLRVLAFRFQGVFNNAKKDKLIPVFRLAKLGNGETLRGYETSRFQAANLLHLNTEYRLRLMQGYDKHGFTGVEGVFFGDFGQVFDSRAEVKWRNVKATYGGGLRFMTKKSTALTLLYARSPEGGRIIWKLGKTF